MQVKEAAMKLLKLWFLVLMPLFVPLALLNEKYPAFTARFKWPLLAIAVAAGIVLCRFFKVFSRRAGQQP